MAELLNITEISNIAVYLKILMVEMNSNDFLIAFRRGERTALQKVYRQYAGTLRYFAEQLVKNQAVAEDIATEALVKAFRKHAAFESLDKFRAYLYISVNNAALDYLKTRKRHLAAHEEIKYISPEEMEDVELLYIKAESIRALHNAINELPNQTRKVITMLYIEEKRLSEIAAELNLSYNTVQNYRARGIELLQNKLVKSKFLTGAVVAAALNLLGKS